ncbi:hypothetical protein WR25_05668 isoform B [Diploscapter pachys]|uniref:Major facilitator superfamily (MFS) profile domain-containing protein n=1 Tax=Diploscapter pachys TaxID=2018661 RepID=A0A2A2LI42_9BILA|nr:hypothetical protein WR25_05668 isoform B [Diploscapter pachys]
MCVGPLPLYYVYKFDTSWEWTYYVIGFGSLVTSIAFSLTYHDDLTKNKYLTEEERQQIIEGKTEKEQSKHKEPVPHSDLLTDIAIWSCLILFIAYYIGMINYQLYSPTFIKETLGYTIRETGYFSAIPNILGIIIKIGLGKLIDCDFGLSNKWRLATPLIVLEAISALSLFLAGFSDNRVASLIFLMTFASMHFFVPVICSRTIQMIGAQHAHFAMNVNMVIAGGIQIVVPMLVVLIVPDNTREQVGMFNEYF